MFVLVCVAMWLLAVGLLSWFVLFFVLLFCLMDSVEYCDQQFGEEGTSFFAFLWFVACLLSVKEYLLFLLMTWKANPGHHRCYFCCTCVSIDSLGVHVSVVS